MAKISTLTAMSLVPWLAMSIATWAEESWTEWTQRDLGVPQRNEVDDDGKPPTEEEIGAFLNVMRGAEVALQADNFQTTLAMVAGVAARLNATNLPAHEKAAKFREMLPIIEDTVEKDNKAKAIALINTLAEEFKKKDENEQGGGFQKRGLLESKDMRRNKQEEGGDSSTQQKKKQMLQNFLQQAFTAIKEDQRVLAEEILSSVYRLLKNDKTLSKQEKAIKFIQAIEETEKYLKEDAMDKAEQVLQGAALGMGIVEGMEQAAKNKTNHGTDL